VHLDHVRGHRAQLRLADGQLFPAAVHCTAPSLGGPAESVFLKVSGKPSEPAAAGNFAALTAPPVAFPVISCGALPFSSACTA
jgi:hypothetical protein